MTDLPRDVRLMLAGVERGDARSTLKAPNAPMKASLGVVDDISNTSAETALRHADVFACVRVIADSVGSIPLHVYRRTETGREQANDTLAGQLLRRPSPTMTQSALLSTLAAHLATWGNGFIAKYRARQNGPVLQLGLIHPRRVSVGMRHGEPVFRVSGIEGELSRRDLTHVMGMSFDGLIGVAPLSQARSAIGVGVALEDQAAAFLKNNATPNGVIEVQGELDQEAMDRIRRGWDALLTGRGRGRTAILEDGMKWSAVSLPAKDAQFIEQRRLSATQIARIFRVPPYMIGADNGASMTYSNVEQETLQLVTHTLRPWLIAIEQAIAGDEDLFSPSGGIYPEFLIDALLRADTLTRYQAYQIALSGEPFMTLNEVRGKENLADQADGDIVGTAKQTGGTT